MKASELKAAILAGGMMPFFFTRDTMRFFGDTMKNYGVRGPVTVQSRGGPIPCWELYRKKPVKHGLQTSTFFDVEKLDRIFPVE